MRIFSDKWYRALPVVSVVTPTLHAAGEESLAVCGTDVAELLAGEWLVAADVAGDTGLLTGPVRLVSWHALTTVLAVQPNPVRVAEGEGGVIQRYLEKDVVTSSQIGSD